MPWLLHPWLCPGCFTPGYAPAASPLVMPRLLHPWLCPGCFTPGYALAASPPVPTEYEARGAAQQVRTFWRRVNFVTPVKNTIKHHPARSPDTTLTALKLSNTCQVHSWIVYFPVYPTLYLHKLHFTYSESGVHENPYHSKDSNQQIITISSRLPVSPWSESYIFHHNFNHKH